MLRRQSVFYGNYNMCSCLRHSGTYTVVIPVSYTHLKPEKEDTCSMCGNFCAVKNTNRILDGEIVTIFDE